MSRTVGHLPLASLSLDSLDMEDYEVLGEVGTGAYGTVYEARNRTSGLHVALKRVPLLSGEEGVPVTTVREVTLLRQLGNGSHPNIVRLFDVILLKDGHECNLGLVFEYLQQDLENRMKQGDLTPSFIKNTVRQLLNGLDFLHSHRVVHRDLKPQNILVARDDCIKVADFGLARLYHSGNMTLTTKVVTLWYRSPEVLLVGSYDFSVDIWSLGCIWAEMLCRRPLFPGKNEADQLTKIFCVMGTPSSDEWPSESSIPRAVFDGYSKQDLQRILQDASIDTISLLELMLTFNVDTRISAQHALNLPYFSS
ncbi:cyclin-dependent kinase 6-like [Corticium candelabrum]|uniref:cyclin-dependent kinase 6-like n=1 Tax=Corticium candelabrum TaxID=121492 RepID=UPI002E25FC53|nr:cyclin-dependent kinase 6-like [Corticium candelabrum]